jgi:hypothetical protein
MKLLRFLLLICTMQSFGVMAQTTKRQPPTLLIDNSSVDGERKNKVESELNPKSAIPKQEYIVQSFGPITFCNVTRISSEKNCQSFERFFKIQSANFYILDEFNISMGIEDILKRCSYHYVTGGNMAGGQMISSSRFKCKHEKLTKESSLDLYALRYSTGKALQLVAVVYETCSPPWTEVKSQIFAKFSPRSSRFTVDKSHNGLPENSFKFYANVGEFEELKIIHVKNNDKCPGGLGLRFELFNNINFLDESIELQRLISEEAAKKTPGPKF